MQKYCRDLEAGAHPARSPRSASTRQRIEGLTGIWLDAAAAEDRQHRRAHRQVGHDARLRAQRRPRPRAVHRVDHRLRPRGRRVHDDGARARTAAQRRRRPRRGRRRRSRRCSTSSSSRFRHRSSARVTSSGSSAAASSVGVISVRSRRRAHEVADAGRPAHVDDDERGDEADAERERRRARAAGRARARASRARRRPRAEAPRGTRARRQMPDAAERRTPSWSGVRQRRRDVPVVQVVRRVEHAPRHRRQRRRRAPRSTSARKPVALAAHEQRRRTPTRVEDGTERDGVALRRQRGRGEDRCRARSARSPKQQHGADEEARERNVRVGGERLVARGGHPEEQAQPGRQRPRRDVRPQHVPRDEREAAEEDDEEHVQRRACSRCRSRAGRTPRATAGRAGTRGAPAARSTRSQKLRSK